MSAVLVQGLMLLGSLTAVLGSAGNVWTYRGSKGPDNWHLDYPHCGGIRQSPISIVTRDVIVDTDHLRPIVFSGYDAVYNVNMTLENNGHTVQVNLNEPYSTISGGGLPGEFVAQQFHFHWGSVDSRGSEHDINGRHFPMEMHVVHHNNKYSTMGDAMDKSDGLAVLGFFFEVGKHNSHFDTIINNFDSIKFKENNVSLAFVPLIQLIPAKLSTFYRYSGSLTTPPCYESVTWTLFNETIEIAEEQLERFRTTIFENDGSKGDVSMDVSDDFRPPQCMFRRNVYASHDRLKYSHAANNLMYDPNSANQIAAPSPAMVTLLTSLLYTLL